MIKKLMKSIREYKRESIMTPIIVILEVFMEILIPYLMARLIDHIEDGNMEYIVKIGIFLIVCAALALLFGGLAGKFAATASAGFAKTCVMICLNVFRISPSQTLITFQQAVS